jgi:predicted O-linked N-acetylglucosamine transferase (SPINDLY family)
MARPGNSCQASRNHPANLRVPDSEAFAKQFSVAAFAAQYESTASNYGTQLFAGYRDLVLASSNPSANEAYCICDQQGRKNGDKARIAYLSG